VPLSAWILLFIAVGVGFVIEVVFLRYVSRRHRD
jgi:uncharacterized membrane-anchored protein YhcB (DUF1043 family)